MINAPPFKQSKTFSFFESRFYFRVSLFFSENFLILIQAGRLLGGVDLTNVLSPIILENKSRTPTFAFFRAVAANVLAENGKSDMKPTPRSLFSKPQGFPKCKLTFYSQPERERSTLKN